MLVGRGAVLLLGAVLGMSILSISAPEAEAHHIKMTKTQQQYRDLYSSTVGISAHRIIERYLMEQYLHVPPYSPVVLSPQVPADKVELEKPVRQANVVFRFPLPTKPGKGGRLDFAAKYTDSQGECWWEVHEIKPAGWHYRGGGPAAMAQLQSYINGIGWDKSGDFEGCSAREATRWREGQPGWHTIPPKFAPLYDAYNVKLQVQTWYGSEPGIVYYRFVWKDRDSRRQALKGGLSRNLAELVNKIARNELPLSNRYVYGELIPWMWAMRHEDWEAGGDWEDQDALQELIDIKLSLDDPATAADEDENTDFAGGCDLAGICEEPRQRNTVDQQVTTKGMVEYWEKWSTPDPWYFKDWLKAFEQPWTFLPGGTRCVPHAGNKDKPYQCAS